MSPHELMGIASIVVLGVVAQWLAWRLHLPSILLLLVFGFIAGPITGFLSPQELIGDVLFPFVSFSVALILFEGGMTLHLSELGEIHRSVRNLVTVGALVTWVATTALAYYILHFSFELALLLGAILIVTGPTVIIPLLRHVRPVDRVGSVIKWEGILNDPVGATAAVLVFEVVRVGLIAEAPTHVVAGFVLTILTGVVLGLVGTLIVIVFLKQYWVPDFLQSPFTLMCVVGAFAASNLIQHESGLLTVTLMGVGLANQPWVAVKHIIEFKENLRVILLSSLFVLLAARISIAEVERLDLNSFLFVLCMILIVRPLAVWISTLGTRLSWQEKLFLAWMAPRGVVAAAVASLFALDLTEAGFPEAQAMVPVTFLLIVSTVAIYGLTAKPLANWLKLAQSHPQGFLIVGAKPWTLGLADALRQLGIDVVLADTNWQNISAARLQGFTTYYGNALSEEALDHIPLDGVGKLLALTPNDEANSLACLHFVELFGRAEVYQLPPRADQEPDQPLHLRGRKLFHKRVSSSWFEEAFRDGAKFKATKLSEEFGFQDFLNEHDGAVLPLFLLQTQPATSQPQLRVFTLDRDLNPKAGDQVVAVVGAQRPSSRRKAETRSPSE